MHSSSVYLVLLRTPAVDRSYLNLVITILMLFQKCVNTGGEEDPIATL